LHNLSVDAEFEGKNNIVVNNRKVSGNAEHIYRQRVLHHGTLLFNTQLDNLNEAIRVLPGRYKDKAVQSNRGAVANIGEYLKSDMNILEFRNMLLKHIITNYYNSRIYEVNDKDLEGIETLVEIKYSAWEWIYGYSPKYSLNCIYKTGKSEVIFRIFVENGIIKDLEVNRNNGSEKVLLILPGLFTGLPHRESDLREKTDKISELLTISRAEADKIVDSMF
jgi:lipoate-protein ligase A